MAAEAVRFDENLRSSTSDHPVPAGSVIRVMRRVAETAGLDVTAELYNEALRHASEGHLSAAREQLTVLTLLAPEDGDARLALAKVEVSSQRWEAALKALDEARSFGVKVPSALRRAVEDHLKAESAAEEEQLAAIRAREQGEIKALRQETRRLRSENALQLGLVHQAEYEKKKWAWVASVSAGVSVIFTLAVMIFGGKAATVDEIALTTPVADEALVVEEVEEEVPTTPAAPAPVAEPTPTDLAITALRGLPWLRDGQLSVLVDGRAATLSGTVRTAKELKQAEAALLSVRAIKEVNTAQVSNLAKTHGTTHVVRPGDHLGKIASEYYGGVSYGDKILAANRAKLKSANSLQVGQELIIPRVD
ncbi:MAG: LysM peptidoglycan-binding domain-containing protein [Deltaproteobacteria bacterium]|nr:LysM peptidoglycan-binding domain-containing protein [Deltaproteobacteria bacterium]